MPEPGEIRLMLCGDVMLGRGIDQVLPHPGDPALPQSSRKGRDARLYVALAELRNGPLPRRREADYVWGDGPGLFAALRPDLRLVNLETAVTARGTPWPGKKVHYRLHPKNIAVLRSAGIDFCALANNHTLDFGYDGLADTLEALAHAGIPHAGAGSDRGEAVAPAVLRLASGGRVLAFSAATTSSGCPAVWGAEAQRAGINLVRLDDAGLAALRAAIAEVRRPGDRVVVSLHWNDNYVRGVHPIERAFAQRLVDEAGVDLVHGHSSHHVRGIEVHSGRLILYGCGDLVNDYEGILKLPGQLAFEPDLGLVYLARLGADDGRLLGLEMVPTRMLRLQLCRAGRPAAGRLAALLNREGKALGTSVVERDGTLHLRWQGS